MRNPILILGMVPRITTPIARSLARHGIAVDVATFSDIERPVGSRSIRNFWRVLPLSFVDALAGMIREHCHDMLIPANDVALSAMFDHYNSFKNILHVACPPPGDHPTCSRQKRDFGDGTAMRNSDIQDFPGIQFAGAFGSHSQSGFSDCAKAERKESCG
jgi:hypothetical protein